jgi:hypothetical protein
MSPISAAWPSEAEKNSAPMMAGPHPYRRVPRCRTTMAGPIDRLRGYFGGSKSE